MRADKTKLEKLATATAQRLYGISWRAGLRGADYLELKRLFRRSVLSALKRATR